MDNYISDSEISRIHFSTELQTFVCRQLKLNMAYMSIDTSIWQPHVWFIEIQESEIKGDKLGCTLHSRWEVMMNIMIKMKEMALVSGSMVNQKYQKKTPTRLL